MKKQLIFLIILLSLLAVCVPTVKAQVFFTLEPSFFKVGILYNQKIGKMDKIGLYSRVNYGNIKDEGFYTDNVKVGIGMSIPIRQSYEENKLALYFGPNYSHYFNTSGSNPTINLDKIYPISIDIGISLTKGRFTILLMSDLPNWESLVGFSYRLSKYKHNDKKNFAMRSKSFCK